MFRHLPHLSLRSHPIPVPQTSLHPDSPWVRRGWELRASGLCSRCFTNWAISLDSLESIFSKSWKRKSYQLSSRDSQSNDDPSTSNFISVLFCKLLFSLSPPSAFQAEPTSVYFPHSYLFQCYMYGTWNRNLGICVSCENEFGSQL